MQPSTKETRQTSPEFPPDELLIFIGYSDDASAEALAILELQLEIKKDFRLLLKSNGNRSPFRRIRLWEWTQDSLALSSGQEAVVTPALDRAQIALFVFRDRVGKVTWEELEKARRQSREKSLHILAFFPETSPLQTKVSKCLSKTAGCTRLDDITGTTGRADEGVDKPRFLFSDALPDLSG
jgi:hypothetical protein